MQRRRVQDPQHACSAARRWSARGTVAKVGLGLVTLGAALALAAPPAGAAATQSGGCSPRSGPVAVVKVDGLIDPVLADYIEDQIAAAEGQCALALVLRLDSGGAVVSGGEL